MTSSGTGSIAQPPIGTQSLAAVRLALRAKGYSVIPLNGKSPVLKNWRDAPQDETTIKSWSIDYPFARSTGAIHDGLVMALDCDIYSQALMEQVVHPIVRRHLPTAPLRIGQAPKAAYFFRADAALRDAPTSVPIVFQDQTATATSRIEVRGVGGQTVVHGIHPTTDKPYRWPEGELPDVTELPALMATDLADLIQELTNALAQAPHVTMRPGGALTVISGGGAKAQSSPMGTKADPAFVRALLQALPNRDLEWDTWFKDVLIPVKTALADEPDLALDAFETWSKKSTKHDLAGMMRWWDSIDPRGVRGIATLVATVKTHGTWTSQLEAMRNAHMQAGMPPAAAQFSPVPGTPVPASPAPPTLPTPTAMTVPSGLPQTLPEPRPWLYGYHVLRGAVSLLAGRGGASKTNLALTEGLGIACGRKLLWDRIWYPSGLRVLHLNRDEPQAELDRRVLGIAREHRVVGQEAEALSYLGRDRLPDAFRLVDVDASGQPRVSESGVEWLTGLCSQLGVGVLYLDPLVLFCGGESNDHFTALNRALSRITVGVGVGVVLVHHLRKGGGSADGEREDDVDAIRGGSTLVDLARVGRVVRRMTGKQAEQLGITDADLSNRLVSVNRSVKENYSLSPKDLSWYKLKSVGLGNASAPYDEDQIGVPVEWTPAAMGALTLAQQGQLLGVLQAGMPSTGEPWTTHKMAGERHVSTLAEQLDLHPDIVGRQVRDWLRDGTLVEDSSWKSPKGKPKRGLRVANRHAASVFS